MSQGPGAHSDQGSGGPNKRHPISQILSSSSDRLINAAKLAVTAADLQRVLSMKLGIICPNLPGHLNPMTALARHLQARNHEVVFLYSTEANGLPFLPGPEKDHICHHRKASASIGVAETDLGLYHRCRVEHRARIFGSRSSANSHPDNL